MLEALSVCNFVCVGLLVPVFGFVLGRSCDLFGWTVYFMSFNVDVNCCVVGFFRLVELCGERECFWGWSEGEAAWFHAYLGVSCRSGSVVE